MREKNTVPAKLAIFGGSNSGLLVGAAVTQRPDLFRAVLCIAPLLDMVRYERFDQAAKWQAEYGSVENEDDFHALYAYSPYHHVRSRGLSRYIVCLGGQTTTAAIQLMCGKWLPVSRIVRHRAIRSWSTTASSGDIRRCCHCRCASML